MFYLCSFSCFPVCFPVELPVFLPNVCTAFARPRGGNPSWMPRISTLHGLERIFQGAKLTFQATQHRIPGHSPHFRGRFWTERAEPLRLAAGGDGG